MLKSPQSFTWWNNMLLNNIIAKWGRAFGYRGEQGAKFLHNEFNKLNRTYCSIKPNTKRLEYILKEHHRQVNPEAKAIQPKTKKRKIEL